MTLQLSHRLYKTPLSLCISSLLKDESPRGTQSRAAHSLWPYDYLNFSGLIRFMLPTLLMPKWPVTRGTKITAKFTPLSFYWFDEPPFIPGFVHELKENVVYIPSDILDKPAWSLDRVVGRG